MNYTKIILIFCFGVFLSVGRNANAQSNTYNYSGSVQAWTVPCGVSTITINASGAQGNGDAGTGGLGAQIIGTFTVTTGNVLDIMVGKEGANDPNNGAGGGGGSFIWNSSQSNTLMVAAGGGGGGTVNDPYPATYGGGGSATTTPSTGWGAYTAAGGSGGNGGSGGTNGAGTYAGAGGGCGWFSNGANGQPGSSSNPGGGGGATPLNGGAGGIAAQTWGAVGGYGGAGGGGISGGGGGGYNGGGGGNAYPISPNTCGGGGGGGSFNGGVNQTNTAAIVSGNGTVTISWTVISLSVAGNVISNVTCNGGNNGKASGIITGGSLPYSYVWALAGGTKDTATGLAAGTYTIGVLDACGSTATAQVSITQPTPLNVSAVVLANELCNGGNTGSASANVSGGTSPYTYAWTPAGGSNVIATGLSAGTFNINVTDMNGCTGSASVSITQPNPLSVTDSTTTNVLCNGGNTGSAAAIASNGTSPYVYLWIPNGGTNANATGLTAGTYTIIVSDACGASATATTIVKQPAPLAVVAHIKANVLCNGGNNGSATSTVSGGTSPYSYQWSNGKTIDSVSGLTAGTTTLVVVDSNGCTVSGVVTITQPTALSIVKNSAPDGGSSDGAAWVNVSGGVSTYTYLWAPGGSTIDSIFGKAAGIYCCTVTDAQGCIDSACVTINSNAGINSITSGSGAINVYPNPTNGQFTIESSSIGRSSSVEIYNVLGEKVYTMNLNNGTTSINMGNKPDGIYLYRVINNQNGNLVGEGKITLQK